MTDRAVLLEAKRRMRTPQAIRYVPPEPLPMPPIGAERRVQRWGSVVVLLLFCTLAILSELLNFDRVLP